MGPHLEQYTWILKLLKTRKLARKSRISAKNFYLKK